MEAEIERWPLRAPFAIAGQVFHTADLLVVTLRDGAAMGRGEAAGVFFKGETPESMRAQLAALGPDLPGTRDRLLGALPPGGARNALDLALWDLEARRCGVPVWELAGLPPPAPLATAFTIGLATPETVAGRAAALDPGAVIKLKLGGPDDAEILEAVRAVRPDATLLVDANSGWDADRLEALVPALAAAGVALVEQPLPPGADDALAGLDLPFPVAADEALCTRADLPRIAGRYSHVNIKLDKAGGLTEALALAAAARSEGLGLMVGCMECTSLGLAPAFLLAQGAHFADLDGAWLLADDRADRFRYAGGQIAPPAVLPWGDPHA